MGSRDELDRLRRELGTHLTDAGRLKKPEGVPTGLAPLDEFLVWNGFPKGGLTALTGNLGLGATSLWVEAAAHVTRAQRWVAWVDREAQLCPLALKRGEGRRELNLSRLVTIEAPETEKKLLWLLQELMASTLFDLIGCDLGQVSLCEHQLRKLEKQAQSFNTALVFFASRDRLRNLSLFNLVVNFLSREIRIERALHRQTPHLIPRRITYADFAFHTRDRLRPGAPPAPTAFGGLEPSALLDPSRSSRREGRDPDQDPL